MNTFVIANWKCHKSTDDARQWFADFSNLYRPSPEIKVIVAPSVISLESLASYKKDLKLDYLALAAQDVSPFPKGSYTGAIAADMLREFVEYVIIGHSERRRYFHETSQDVANKMSEVVDAGLKPIVCVDRPYAMSQLRVLNDIDSDELIIAYGPVDSLAVRIPENPDQASKTAKFISEIHPGRPIVYGGSLEADNVQDYVNLPELAGLFVGQASLEAESFASICNTLARAK